MWRILVCSLLVAVAAGQGSGFSSALDLDDGYLPPGPDNITPNSVRCDPPKTYYSTRTNRVTTYVTKTVTRAVPQVIQKTVVVSQVVPSTVLVTSVKEVKSPVVRTQVKTDVVNRVVIKTVNVPGETRVVTTTRVQDQISYKTEQRVVELTNVVTSTRVQLTTVVQRVVKTVTETVPKVVYVTKTVQVPGRNVVVTVTDKKQVTRVQKYQPPAKTEVRNEIKYVTKVAIREIPGPVITQANNIVRTEYVQQTRVQKVPQISTLIVKENKEVVLTVTRTNQVTRTDVKYITKTRTVPVVITKTQERLVTVPLKLTKTVTVVKSVPGPDVVRTAVRTEVQVKTVRGPDRVITDVRTVDRVLTSVINKTIIKPSTVIKVIDRTEPCSGYSYDAPKNPLQF